MPNITYDVRTREALRNVYTDHLEKMADDPKLPDHFEFEGNTYLVGYAKYLLEYLDLILKEDTDASE
jgi:hypothetical protein